MKAEDRFVEKSSHADPGLPFGPAGPGDDAAVVEREAGLLAATTDLLVEDVDFLPGEDPERLGRRAAAVNLSDLAAIGAQPEFFLLSIGFPRSGARRTPSRSRAERSRAPESSAPRSSGETFRRPLRQSLSVALWGRPAAEPLRRSGASPGDAVFVSGHPGQAAAGLRLARSSRPSRSRVHSRPRVFRSSDADQSTLLAAFHDPVPRVALGLALARQALATAAIDVSDGLGVDAARLARASQVRVVVEKTLLPVSRPLRAFAEMEILDVVELALAGGDDYELLFTAPEPRRAGSRPRPVSSTSR